VWKPSDGLNPIKKRTNTELFIDRTAALYKGETQIRVGIKEGDLAQKCYLGLNRCGNEIPGVNLSQNEF